ncbi:hypothetical protein AI29_00260 [bacteria symbiont BFo2 of Frankliniella occidentalis]|nr:hypothetical protein AI29_00260 [bacteria symbiont BFo2 of Frankliniella occidentalis]KYP87078.1 hypothetical protein WB60_12770 [bacteria symbiont BFo2 of Frankliniella occidentalis]KYP94917.1 hypothetical protein WB67_08810 [bacteria symbiont BFo2 of Frankliniella occidentalis]
MTQGIIERVEPRQRLAMTKLTAISNAFPVISTYQEISKTTRRTLSKNRAAGIRYVDGAAPGKKMDAGRAGTTGGALQAENQRAN